MWLGFDLTSILSEIDQQMDYKSSFAHWKVHDIVFTETDKYYEYRFAFPTCSISDYSTTQEPIEH